jgi:hypothetical protein
VIAILITLTGQVCRATVRDVKAGNPSHVRTPRLTRLEYEALVERGVLGEDDPIELLDGLEPAIMNERDLTSGSHKFVLTSTDHIDQLL